MGAEMPVQSATDGRTTCSVRTQQDECSLTGTDVNSDDADEECRVKAMAERKCLSLPGFVGRS